MFHDSLQNERDLVINFWEKECPITEGIAFTIPGPDKTKALFWDYAQWVVKWTNSLLVPPTPQILQLMGAERDSGSCSQNRKRIQLSAGLLSLVV
jgi:hypothetical protein